MTIAERFLKKIYIYQYPVSGCFSEVNNTSTKTDSGNSLKKYLPLSFKYCCNLVNVHYLLRKEKGKVILCIKADELLTD